MKKTSLILLSLFLFACSDQQQETAANVEPANQTTANNSSSPSLQEQEQEQPPALQAVDIKEGIHYQQIKNPIISDKKLKPNTVTVTEFFWYGCSHCKNFEPLLHSWHKQQSHIKLIQSPAVWNQPMELHAMAFFIAQTLEQAEQLHHRLFDEVIKLRNEKSLDAQIEKLANVFSEYGLPQPDFKQQLQSPALEDQVKNSIKLMQQAEVSGTPMILVNGQYRVLTDQISSLQDIFTITEYLINKELKQD